MFVGELKHMESRDFEKMCSTNKSGALQQYCSDVYNIIKENGFISWKVGLIPEEVWKSKTKVASDVLNPFIVHPWGIKRTKIDLIFTDEEEAMLFKLIYEGNEDESL